MGTPREVTQPRLVERVHITLLPLGSQEPRSSVGLPGGRVLQAESRPVAPLQVSGAKGKWTGEAGTSISQLSQMTVPCSSADSCRGRIRLRKPLLSLFTRDTQGRQELSAASWGSFTRKLCWGPGGRKGGIRPRRSMPE